MIVVLLAAVLAMQSADGKSPDRADARCSAELAFAIQPSGNAAFLTRREDKQSFLLVTVPEPPADWKGRKFSVELVSGEQFAVPPGAIYPRSSGGIEVLLALPGTSKPASFRGGALSIGDLRVPINISSGDTPLDILHRCGDDFIRRLGVDPGSLVGIDGDEVVRLFSAGDYPGSARRAGIEGRVLVVFSIGAGGKATSCKIAVSSGSDELDARTCEIIMKRGRFAPGTSGAPTSWIAASIRWGLGSRN